MAVSKRTRFEVLRRDNYTCRYCRSAENLLTVDHVTPVALGGSDDPDNLVAACRDCNSGKASSTPDDALVEDVKADAIRWAAAMKLAVERDLVRLDKQTSSASRFEELWRHSTLAPLPQNWPQSIATFRSHGLTERHIKEAVAICESRSVQINPGGMFRYFCGICWAKIREIRAEAEQILADCEAEGA